ncbi:neurogenic locus Notch protein-like [Xenia sp. Carnegie-2017]|uniref:neurogenic locus Notch protein-like n=1 Tax=Xenia sp. Carnegie-2017 TaxID=2897299 RepID=UPI001F03E231|nr:neurogenic locus Notch protein-like [Xenia sp. Carnegie-2017]
MFKVNKMPSLTTSSKSLGYILFLWTSLRGVFSLSGDYQLKLRQNKVLPNEECFRNAWVENVSNCLQECLGECRCVSFQMCQTNNCQLCSGGDVGNLMNQSGCSYFTMKKVQFSQQREESCLPAINCCLTSQPCLDGGTCSMSDDPLKRYSCKCKKNRKGERCELDVVSWTTG